MKNSFLFLLSAILSIGFAYAQPFEGEIIYTNQFVSKTKNFTDEQLAIMIGTKQEYTSSAGLFENQRLAQCL
jgi:hypothetical protein